MARNNGSLCIAALFLLTISTAYAIDNTSKTNSCIAYPEIILVEDASWSYRKDSATFAKILPQLLKYLNNSVGNNYRLGVASFVDKYIPQPGVPIKGYTGDKGDYCAKIHLPITDMLNKSDVTSSKMIMDSLATIKYGGGGDYLEGLDEGLFRLALSNQTAWANSNYNVETGRPIVRIIIAGTDAPIHGETALAKYGMKLPHMNLKNTLDQLHKDVNVDCSKYNYPSAIEVGEALKQRQVYPMIIVTQPNQRDPRDGQLHITEHYDNWILENGYVGTAYDKLDQGLAAFYEDWLKKANVLGKTFTMKESEDISKEFITSLNKYLITESAKRGCEEPQNTNTTTGAPTSKGPSAAVIGGASAGAAVGAVAVAGVAAKAMGVGPFSSSSAPVDNTIMQDVENVEVTQDREQFEAVTGDLFS